MWVAVLNCKTQYYSGLITVFLIIEHSIMNMDIPHLTGFLAQRFRFPSTVPRSAKCIHNELSIELTAFLHFRVQSS